MKSSNTNVTESVTQQPKKKNKWTGKIVIIALFLVSVIVYLVVPPVNEAVNSIIKMFQTGNFSAMRSFIAQYGPYAMVVSSILMIFQSLAAPLPAFFITLTNANLFGWWQGCILSFVSSMAGAALCFFIARILGRDIVEKICTKGALKQIEDFFDKYGKKCILVARLLPFISFDVVSYAAGASEMRFKPFLILSAIGRLPGMAGSLLMGNLLEGEHYVGLGIVVVIAVIAFLTCIIFRRHIDGWLDRMYERIRK